MFVREAGRGAPRQLARLQIRLHLFVHLVDSREALCLTLRCAMARHAAACAHALAHKLARERAAAKTRVYEACWLRAELPKSSRPASERDLVAIHDIHADGLLGEPCMYGSRMARLGELERTRGRREAQTPRAPTTMSATERRRRCPLPATTMSATTSLRSGSKQWSCHARCSRSASCPPPLGLQRHTAYTVGTWNATSSTEALEEAIRDVDAASPRHGGRTHSERRQKVRPRREAESMPATLAAAGAPRQQRGSSKAAAAASRQQGSSSNSKAAARQQGSKAARQQGSNSSGSSSSSKPRHPRPPDEFGLDALACIVAVGHQFGHAAGIPSGTSGTRRVVRLERQGGFRCLALLPLRQRQRRSPVPSPCVSDRDAPWDFISPASPASSKHKLVCEDADKGDDRQRPSATIGNGHRQ